MAPTTTKPVCRPMRSTSRTSSPESSAIGSRLHRAADVEGGQHGATGVVLVGERRAEQRHEAVAEELVHRALVAVHLGQRRLEEPAQERVHAVGAERSASAVELTRSQKSTVTGLRSPCMAAREVRIFSARCRGV